jgi:hypothetical protein
MKQLSGPRRTVTLPESLHHQLSMYTLAASAAGVGLLALQSPAEAKIVYTPVHIRLGFYHLDLNHDGITDFAFTNYGASHSSIATSRLSVYSAPPSNAVAGKGRLAPLWPGEEIGSKRRFWQQTGSIERARWHYNRTNHTATTKFYGPWANGGKGFKSHYLGLKFLINGKLHYGWARLNTTGGWRNLGVLTGYAYETIPGKAIIAGQTKEAADDPTKEDFGPGASLTNPIPATPQPASLGVLALGAQGVPLWRRKEATLGVHDCF